MARPTKARQIEKQEKVCEDLRQRIADADLPTASAFGGRPTGMARRPSDDPAVLAARSMYGSALARAEAELFRLQEEPRKDDEPDLRMLAPDGNTWDALNAQFQVRLLERALAGSGMNVLHAAVSLGLTRKQLLAHVSKYAARRTVGNANVITLLDVLS